MATPHLARTADAPSGAGRYCRWPWTRAHGWPSGSTTAARPTTPRWSMRRGGSSSIASTRRRAASARDPTWRSSAMVEAFDAVLEVAGVDRVRRAGGRARHARSGQRRTGVISSTGRRTSPIRPGGASTSAARSRPRLGAAGRLQQRRQRGRARTPTPPTSAPTPTRGRRSRRSSAPASAAVSSSRAGSSRGAAGMAGELGHVHIPMHGLLEVGQPLPECNCGFVGDAESVASLTGIEKNLLPYWLTRYPDHELAAVEPPDKAAQDGPRATASAATRWRSRSSSSRRWRSGRLFTIAANFTDPDAYFVGGGVVEATPEFREWFLGPGARAHPPAGGAGPRRRLRARPRPRHGRRPRLRPRRPRHRPPRRHPLRPR